MDNYELKINDNGQKITKQILWERKLLDFSLRNNLINIRLGKRVVAINQLPQELEDRIHKGETLQLTLEQTTLPSDTELIAVLKNLYRTSRTSLEENGANSLFLALGTLTWYETAKNEKPRKAPVLLLPVEMIRKGGSYLIRSREEETILNITLIELLKQQFKIDISHLNPLPNDENGLDVTRIFTAIRQEIADQKGWEITEESMLGLFSFNKFVMWNDIHTHADQLKDNAIIASLMENRITWTDDTPAADAREIDKQTEPSQFSIPLDVDSSQLEAVIESGQGKSFILHGPPGTGKSQTITNMIANALYRGKRVLFVAEKRAALSVVQKRLSRIGLAPFCLELHSNKVTKSHFLAQMQQALNVLHNQTPERYQNIAQELFNERKHLIEYMEALHTPQASGHSLYDCITHYLSIEGEEMPVDLKQFPVLDDEQLRQLQLKFREIDTVIGLIGHPALHPLHGLDLLQTSQESIARLKELLKTFQGQLYQYTALQLFAADKPELEVPSVDWLPNWEPAAGLAEEPTYQNILKPIQFKWKTVENEWFLFKYFAKKKYLKKWAKGCAAHVQNMRNTYTALNEIARIEMPETNPVTELPQNITRWNIYLDMRAKDWCQWTLRKQEVEAMQFSPLIDYLVDQQKSGQQTVQAFCKGYYHQLALQIVDSNRALRLFNSELFETYIYFYKMLASEFQELSKKELYNRLAARIPSLTIEAAASSEMGILKRNIANGGRGVSIRRIIDQIPTLLPKLCPCMLMSPISVAQYIDLNSDKFDIVIFDEASQMPTSEAVGAIARGKALIVVGDPKQMPPTNFFNSNQVDEEEAEYDDMESILDDCISLSIPSRYLTWHYRSKHESLIAFSNAEYYDGKLHTFPSVDDRCTKVSLVKIDGSYDKGRSRCNRAEAEAIVQEVIRRLQSPELSAYSIGIVSFSQVQQHLIEDILMETLAKHPKLERIAFGGEEPIFVKNLENVQGDERDVILFSVGYGPDENGQVSMNFGPLNNQGGERRLNVAVSRSRTEMMVFSTLRADQIDLRRTQAKGVEGLKKFLLYAERGNQALPTIPSAESEKYSLVNLIASELRQQGHQVDTQVGRSNFKVDLAILDPKQPNRYLLGILCDGKNYFRTPTTRDREIVQPNVLRSLDWNIMRVWSLDWFSNKEKVLEDIRQTLEKLQQEKEKPAPEPPVTPTPVATVTPQKPVAASTDLQQEYQETGLPIVKGKPNLEKALSNPEKVKQQIQQIIATEQPILNTLLYRRIAKLWNTRATANLQAMIDDLLIPYYMDKLSTPENRIYWANKEASADYKKYRTLSDRKVEEVPVIELINAVRDAVNQQGSVPQDDLKKTVTRMMGIARRKAELDNKIDEVIQYLLQEKVLEIDHEKRISC